MVREVARTRLAPRVAEAEAASSFPADLVQELGSLGLLGLPYPREFGGGGQSYEVYLQVLEELATAWLTVAETISVHTLASYPVAVYGTGVQRERWLEGLVTGRHLGAFCLTEPDAGSDAAALETRAIREGGGYVVDGTKAWITHAGHADVYNLFVRTGGPGPEGISCLVTEAATPGLSVAPAEQKMGLRSSPVARLHLDSVRIAEDQLVGREGDGFAIAMAALDAGRMGVAACAVGLAQAALDCAVAHAGQRHQFGRPISQFQGVGFMLADMATAVEAARHMYRAAARRRDAHLPCSKQAAMSKVFCTDSAMNVTTAAVQILGAVGYTEQFPVERYMREAKVLQIIEGTNQIQRLVISRLLTTTDSGDTDAVRDSRSRQETGGEHRMNLNRASRPSA